MNVKDAYELTKENINKRDRLAREKEESDFIRDIDNLSLTIQKNIKISIDNCQYYTNILLRDQTTKRVMDWILEQYADFHPDFQWCEDGLNLNLNWSQNG